MKLLIVESPAKAKTIGKYLGGEYRVKASIGHIRDLPKSNKNAVDVDAGFVPHYEIISGKEKIVGELTAAAKKAEEVVLATDPDREGEAIAWHIKEACGIKNPQRIVFHEITKEAIQEAIRRPRRIDLRLKSAQEARRVLDRLFGYDLSALVWKKLRYGLSAGRVQSPALRILVEREREIRAFRPEKFWVIEAVFQTASGAKINFTLSRQPKAEAEAEKIVAAAKIAEWEAAAVEQNKLHRPPRPPFITSTLQQAASSRLGISPTKTMRLAQKLYETGQITYMRTDSTNLSQPALTALAKFIKEQYGDGYLERRVFVTKSKTAQEAHEAIRPTAPERKSAGGNPAEEKLYRLIWRRTIASQMKDALLLKTKIVARAKNADLPAFEALGSVVAFDGWLRADPASRGEEKELPDVKPGEKLLLTKIESIAKETEPPRRYSEAGLIKELERRGLGRPSTYAPIIQTIVNRGYVGKTDHSLKPTDTGEAVSSFLEEHFGQYVSDSFTSEMEDDLDQIAEGKRGYTVTLREFYAPFRQTIEAKQDIAKISNLGEAPEEILCPVCGSRMVFKLGRAGKFLSCARFPQCQGARTETGEALAAPKETGEICPVCGGRLVEREGRYGKFIACANFPKCKFVKKDAAAEAVKDTGARCPLCGKGTMVEKRGRYGVFYGCSNYPNCKHLIKNRPTGKICGSLRENGPCRHLIMAGTKTAPESCSDKTCPNYQLGVAKRRGWAKPKSS